MTETVHRFHPVRCQVCERIVERQSRQQVYCSTRCRMRASRKSPADALKKSAGYPYSGRVTNPHKFESENNILQLPKTGSSVFCNGPLNLLGGGSWKWPAAGHLDSKTLTKIRWCEVGVGELLTPPDGDASS